MSSLTHDTNVINVVKFPRHGTFLDVIKMAFTVTGHASPNAAEAFEAQWYARYSWLRQTSFCFAVAEFKCIAAWALEDTFDFDAVRDEAKIAVLATAMWVGLTGENPNVPTDLQPDVLARFQEFGVRP